DPRRGAGARPIARPLRGGARVAATAGWPRRPRRSHGGARRLAHPMPPPAGKGGVMSRGPNFTIRVGTDFSELSDRALDQALEMASLRPGAEVHVLYVEPDLWASAALSPAFTDAVNADAAVVKVQERAQARIEQMAPHLRKRQIRRVVA